MEDKKELYEGMYILSATLSDDARNKALEKITSGIEQVGGQIHKVHDQGRKKIAYEIRGAREGHYYLLYFTAPKGVLADLWRDYHLNEDLLRFLMLKTDEVKQELTFKQLPE
ncbi:MAG: 30S ribosomal protein S6 [Verrucomicrobia bacterium]|nr:30S ribosomal protein S6 [Verrucomicrobiota bacterium]MBS0646619.1 30S ribosomal protein S6 [Verrucomicrobiota bacterium]